MNKFILNCFMAMFLHFSLLPEYDEFTRVQKDSLQTNVVIMRSDSYPAVFVIAGIVHMGEEEYYLELSDILNACDIVFYEGIEPKQSSENKNFFLRDQNPYYFVSLESDLEITTKKQIEYAKALGLQYQGHILRPKSNWINADLSWEEFVKLLKEYKSQILSLDKIHQDKETIDINELVQSKEKEPGKVMEYRRKIAEEISVQSKKFYTDEDLKPVFEIFVGKRNQAALRKIEPHIYENKVIGMVYGAAHIPDFVYRFKNHWNYSIIRVKWLDAWNFRVSN